MSLSPQELAGQIHGLLSFPVTPFTDDNQLDLRRYRDHLQYMLSANPQALFVCGGTGEFFSLNLSEYKQAVKAAVEEARGKLPIIAGVGYGTKMATDFATVAEEAGVDGLLVMPPYLVHADQEGLYQHYRTIASSTRLGLILYQRDSCVLSADTVKRLTEVPNIIGFKDGHGDMERLIRIGLAVGERLVFLNGMPTAEMSAKAFAGIGVTTYSSAVFNFVPEISWAFFRALTRGDNAEVNSLLDGFFRPFVRLRDEGKGFAISLIKAGVKHTTESVGRARTPLANPSSEQELRLGAIIQHGLSLVRGSLSSGAPAPTSRPAEI